MNKHSCDRDSIQSNLSIHVENEYNRNEISKRANKIQIIKVDGDNQLEIVGFRRNKFKKYVTYVLYFLTLGLLRLFYHWYPHFKLYSTFTKCDLENAEKVLIIDTYKEKYTNYFVKKVQTLNIKEYNRRRSTQTSIMLINGKSHFENNKTLCVRLDEGLDREMHEIRTIKCKKETYVWNPDEDKFQKLVGLEVGKVHSDFYKYKGYNSEKQRLKKIPYGKNEIKIPIQSIPTIFFLEALTPFYIFQVFSIIVWMAESYYYYTIAIFLMSVFGITSSIIQTRRNQRNLNGTVSSANTSLVCRGYDNFEEISSTNLVPGDVIAIPKQGWEMPCDAILLNGQCIVNESMLTGESIPITKTALPNNSKTFNAKEDSNHTLYCGTNIIQTKCQTDGSKVLAVVIRTGFLTTKGDLVRNILYPPPADFKFDSDSYKFIIILAIISFLGVIYTVVSKSSRQISALDILIKSLDLLTIAIPPALPAAMTVGKLYAQKRLKNCKIFCINSRVINVSGSINCVCFDKTGTLTEDGLDMWGVVPVIGRNILEPIRNVESLSNESHLLKGMLTCHSLSMINGELCGYPLDVKMFEATGWEFDDISKNSNASNAISTVKPKGNTGKTIEIFHQYQFSSTLQRMSVITSDNNSKTYEVFCKGSPEAIIALSDPKSVPEDMTKTLSKFTKQGFRVIAMATKELSTTLDPKHLPNLNREDVECDLTFLGLIVLENRLKKETTGIIKTLQDACLKVVMITGDNIQTAVSVAKTCGIIRKGYKIVEIETQQTKSKNQKLLTRNFPYDDVISNNEKNLENGISNVCYVITGENWGNIVKHQPQAIPELIANGVVFARMSGVQKQQLIEALKLAGYYVAMCGDGANDCAALKAAHVGISLSEAEASIASPFTSKEPNISCVPTVIQEGRAALTTSFGVFKLMMCYSLTEFTTTIILYSIDSNLSSMEFLFIDVFLVLNFASFFGNTKAFGKLSKVPPLTSLLCLLPMLSLTLFMAITIFFQLFAFYFVQTCYWFTPFVFDPDNVVYKSYENYAVYSVSMFQYISMAVIFSKGTPYRKKIYTNKIFTVSVILTAVVCGYLTLNPANWIIDLLELQLPPVFSARVTFLLVAFINFVIALVVEDGFVDVALGKILFPKLKRIKKAIEVESFIGTKLSDKNESVILHVRNELKNNENGYDNRAFAHD